jgi:hypothetical protein
VAVWLLTLIFPILIYLKKDKLYPVKSVYPRSRSGGVRFTGISSAQERSFTMAEIKWEKDFHTAVELAGKSHKQVFQDFWFDG